MTFPKPQHREVWHRVCPGCGREMNVTAHQTGKTYRCENPRCGYTLDIPYTGYIPAIRPANVVDRVGDHT